MGDFVTDQTGDLMDLIGQAPGTWSPPVYDQGRNPWTFDRTKNGGLKLSDPDVIVLPCACGYKGSGTANFYETLHFKSQTMKWIRNNCEVSLLNIAMGMDLKNENIGWNAIAGGRPDKIVFDGSNTLVAPASLPTKLCHIDGRSNGNCKNEPASTTTNDNKCAAHPDSC